MHTRSTTLYIPVCFCRTPWSDSHVRASPSDPPSLSFGLSRPPVGFPALFKVSRIDTSLESPEFLFNDVIFVILFFLRGLAVGRVILPLLTGLWRRAAPAQMVLAPGLAPWRGRRERAEVNPSVGIRPLSVPPLVPGGLFVASHPMEERPLDSPRCVRLLPSFC